VAAYAALLKQAHLIPILMVFNPVLQLVLTDFRTPCVWRQSMRKRIAALILSIFLILCCARSDGAVVPAFRGYVKGQSYQYILFGRYPTGADGTIGLVQWRILEVIGSEALILSEYIIDTQQVVFCDDEDMINNHTYRRITGYLDSDLYPWMNTVMLNNLFTEDEQRVLVEEERGWLYCLYTEEYLDTAYGFASTPWNEQKSRQCEVTEYLKAQGYYADDQNHSYYWVADIKSKSDYKMQLAGINGHLSYGAYTLKLGLRPGTKLNLDLCEAVSGSGTIGDPFVLVPKP
jgi:hypothetical protein